MKQVLLFLSIVLMYFLVISCHTLSPSNKDELEYIIVHIGVSDDTQTKGSSSNDIYGINVLYDPLRNGVSDTYYAYGIFDNKENMSFTLLNGYTYKFECTLVKDGKTILYCGPYGSNTFSGYAKPFQTDQSGSTQLLNTFVYGTDYLSGITSGAATVKSASTGYEDKAIPSILRYYGEVEGYKPISEGNVEIPLKKTVFGTRMIIDKVSEGRLTANCVINTDSYTLLSGIATNKLFDSGIIIYSYPDVRDCWLNETKISSTVNWTYTSSLFDQWNQSGNKHITFKRNILTTITVSCSPDYAIDSIQMYEEEFGDNNEIYLSLNSDGVIVVTVKPEND